MSLANSAELALTVGEGLAAATLERTKVAREALLAEAASVAARPAAMNLGLEVDWQHTSLEYILTVKHETRAALL